VPPRHLVAAVHGARPAAAGGRSTPPPRARPSASRSAGSAAQPSPWTGSPGGGMSTAAPPSSSCEAATKDVDTGRREGLEPVEAPSPAGSARAGRRARARPPGRAVRTRPCTRRRAPRDPRVEVNGSCPASLRDHSTVGGDGSRRNRGTLEPPSGRTPGPLPPPSSSRRLGPARSPRTQRATHGRGRSGLDERDAGTDLRRRSTSSPAGSRRPPAARGRRGTRADPDAPTASRGAAGGAGRRRRRCPAARGRG
jgi:hypothetical protein